LHHTIEAVPLRGTRIRILDDIIDDEVGAFMCEAHRDGAAEASLAARACH